MASTAPTKEPKTALQEDDEFEDFPVEGAQPMHATDRKQGTCKTDR